MLDSGHARFLHDGARLHVAIQGHGEGWAHVYLAWGDTVRVLHASAALGSVRYARAADGAWNTGESFVYEFRDTSLSPAAEEGRARYLATHGWVGSLFGMGEPGAPRRRGDAAVVPAGGGPRSSSRSDAARNLMAGSA